MMPERVALTARVLTASTASTSISVSSSVNLANCALTTGKEAMRALNCSLQDATLVSHSREMTYRFLGSNDVRTRGPDCEGADRVNRVNVHVIGKNIHPV